jgi:pyridoxamine 5'-phosphate oxidase family protein
MAFTEEEVAYMRGQPLGRLATVDGDGQPDAAPVGFEFDGTYLYVGGYDNRRTRKYRNVQAGNRKVALVLDDLASTQPWAPRFLRIYGTADVVDRDGYAGPGSYLRITPTISWSWNLGGRPYTGGDGFEPRRTVHRPPDRDGEAGRPATARGGSRGEGGAA